MKYLTTTRKREIHWAKTNEGAKVLQYFKPMVLKRKTLTHLLGIKFTNLEWIFIPKMNDIFNGDLKTGDNGHAGF